MTKRRRSAVIWLAVLCAAALAWTAAVLATGGVEWNLGPFTLRSRTPWRPLGIAAVLAAAALALAGRSSRRASLDRISRTATRAVEGLRSSDRFLPSARVAALTVAAIAALVGWTYGSKTASGPDSFGYVSQAALWRSGRLDIPVPLAARAPWPEPTTTFAPFGYRPSPDGRTIVPMMAPGVPMVMATLQAALGHCAAFLVTPFAAALLVWTTFLIGRRANGPAVGLAAACLVATSPAFLFMLMWPMTDIAAAAAAAGMVACLLRPWVWSAAWAGLVGGAGLLVRPNFVLIAAAAGTWLVVTTVTAKGPDRLRHLQRTVAFAAAIAPFASVMAWLNTRWFGSALASGYGTTTDLLDVGRMALNAGRYGGWLIETSPLLAAGLAALVLPVRSLWIGDRAWHTPLLLLVTVAATGGLYLVYQPFTDWWYLRFLLPAWPALAVGTATLVVGGPLRRSWARAVGVVLVATSCVVGVNLARDRGIFGLHEERYVSVARLVAASTEPSAVILTWQHSGTIRYYAGRETVRFDMLDPGWLDRTIEWLQARGRHPYVLVEDWELPLFRERFAGGNTLGPLAFPPSATWESRRGDGRIFLFDPIDKDRHGTADPGDVVERGPRCASSVFPRLAFETARSADIRAGSAIGPC